MNRIESPRSGLQATQKSAEIVEKRKFQIGQIKEQFPTVERANKTYNKNSPSNADSEFDPNSASPPKYVNRLREAQSSLITNKAAYAARVGKPVPLTSKTEVSNVNISKVLSPVNASASEFLKFVDDGRSSEESGGQLQ